MRQVITVSLNNNAYQIDEEAYRALRSYLDRSRSGLQGNPDADEIIEDLERSIGEKCAAALRPGKNVVSFEEMQQILHDTGPVAEESDAGSKPVEPVQSTKDTNTSAPKRLVKRRDNAVIEGVCGGIGEYFGIDVVIVRVLFAAFALLTGFGAILYLILIFAMPEDPSKIAKTTEPGKKSKSATTTLGIIAIVLLTLIGMALVSVGPLMWGGIDYGRGMFMGVFFLLVLAGGLAFLGKLIRSIWPLAVSILLVLAAIGRISGLMPFRIFMMPFYGALGVALIALAIFVGVYLIRHNRSASN